MMRESSPVKKTRTRWWFLLIPALLVGQAAAQGLSTGTEVFVTDASGARLVGYGVVRGSGLQLQLDNVGENFVLMVISPGGSITTLQAVRGADGGLLVAMPNGSYESLSAYFGASDVALTVVLGNRGNGALAQHGPPVLPAAAQASHGTNGANNANGGSESGGGDNPGTSRSNNGKNDN